MLYEYNTYTVFNAMEKFIEDFKNGNTQAALDEVDILDYEHICRLYDTLRLVKIKPTVLMLETYEVDLLARFMEYV